MSENDVKEVDRLWGEVKSLMAEVKPWYNFIGDNTRYEVSNLAAVCVSQKPSLLPEYENWLSKDDKDWQSFYMENFLGNLEFNDNFKRQDIANVFDCVKKYNVELFGNHSVHDFLRQAVKRDASFLPSFYKVGGKLCDVQDVDFVAGVYEQLAQEEKSTVERDDTKNVDEKSKTEIKNACLGLVSCGDAMEFWKVEFSKKYPLFSQDLNLGKEVDRLWGEVESLAAKAVHKLKFGDCDSRLEDKVSNLAAVCVSQKPSLLSEYENWILEIKKSKYVHGFFEIYMKKFLNRLEFNDNFKRQDIANVFDCVKKYNVELFRMGECPIHYFLRQAVRRDASFLPSFYKVGGKLRDAREVDFVAGVYEQLAQQDDTKNVDEKSKTEIKDACLGLVSHGNSPEFWKVRFSKKYPLFSQNLNLDYGYLPASAAGSDCVNLCINNLENPEKENVQSILNRLAATKAKTREDFLAALDFVRKRDMCLDVCRKINDKLKGDENFTSKAEALKATNRDEYDEFMDEHLLDTYPLSYDMAEAGIKDRKTVEKVAGLFLKLNGRPGRYNSDCNHFFPKDLVKMSQLEDWMMPVVKEVVSLGMLEPDRLGKPDDLFAACKAWKICPVLPKAVAEQVGEMPLSKRMVAGAIGETMFISPISRNTFSINRDNESVQEFWNEMSRAQEMSFAEAMKTYIPDTKINRKRFVAAMLEEMGIVSAPEKFKSAYQKMEKEGRFEEFLAAREDVRAERKIKRSKIEKNKENKKSKENILDVFSKSKVARERLVAKGLAPSTGKFGEGHKINIPVKDMSKFRDYVR